MNERDLLLDQSKIGLKHQNSDTKVSIAQIGYRIGVDGSIVEKDYFITRIDSKGKPRYKEELDRFDNIWAQYLNIKEEMKKEGDSRHIFLLTKGKRIEGVGHSRHISGFLTSDVFVVRNNVTNNLNFLYSFDKRGVHVFSIKFNKNGQEGYYGLNRNINILDYNARIDLTNFKDVNGLRSEILRSSTRK